MKIRLATVALALAALFLAACSGVPASSKVDVLRSGSGTQASASAHLDPGPKKGLGPRDLVLGFLQAELTSPSAARQYLTQDAARRWQGQITTVVRGLNVLFPAGAPATSASVPVNGTVLGTVNAAGVYSQQPLTAQTYTIQLRQVDGEWRISVPPPAAVGALVSESDFDAHFTAHALYFLNAGGDRVVPDVRYSLLRSQALAEWLLQELIAGPRPDLTSAVATEMPDQADAARLTVVVPDQTTVRVDYPGASQLDRTTLRRLAVQLAYTLDESYVAPFLTGITLTDGRRPVEIPGIGQSFGRSDFTSFNPDTYVGASGGLYYVQSGSLIAEQGRHHVAGEWGTGTLQLRSAAITSASGVQQVVGVGATGKVYVGPVGGSATTVAMPPATSRPQWQPDSSVPTAWVGTASGLYRITVSAGGAKATVVPMSLTFNSALQGTIGAFVFAPDGTRVAALVDGVVYVGSLVLSGATLSAQNFVPITPAPTTTPGANAGASTTTVSVSDLAFQNSTQIWIIASYDHAAQQIYRISIDGLGLNPASYVPNGGLSDSPAQLASPGGSLVVATIDGVVWSQENNSVWDSIAGASYDKAMAPTYAI